MTSYIERFWIHGKVIWAREPLSIFLPAFIVWAVIDIPAYSWFGGESVAYTLLYWSTIGLFRGETNTIFPFTLAVAIASSLLAFAWLNKFGLDKTRSLLLAASFPFAFTSAFELVWLNGFLIQKSSILRSSPAVNVVLGSWLFLGFSTMNYWKISRKFFLNLIALLVGFGLWFVIGYPQIFLSSNWWLALTLNLMTKGTFASLFLSLLYERTKKSVASGTARTYATNSQNTVRN